MTEMHDADRYVGTPVDRLENRAILTGDAEFIHDRTPPDCLHMALVRSPHPHARIRAIDTTAANAHPDCALTMTAEDIVESFAPMPGRLGFIEWALARETVRFVGEPVVLVVASDRYVAEDIVDLVTVEYEPLDPVPDVQTAATDSILLHADRGTNLADNETLAFGEVNDAFANADHVVEGTYTWGRISGVPLETAGVVASYLPEYDRFEIDCNLQLYTFNTELVHDTLGYPRDRVHVRVPEHIGGSFGTKIAAGTRYCALAGMASYHLERPVKFVEDRIEYLQGGDAHSCERIYTMKVAVDRDGTIRGLDVFFRDDLGAVPRYPLPQSMKPLAVLTTAYEIENVRYGYELYLTNKVPQTAYRGFGVQQHTFALEMIIERAARELDMDPLDFRKANLIPPDRMPYRLPSQNIYDSGDYPRALQRMVDRLNETERTEGGLLDPAVVEARRCVGKYRGTQPIVTLEPSAGVIDYSSRFEMDDEELAAFGRDDVTSFPEHIRATLTADGDVEISLATSAAGQGHRTLVTQLMADALDLPMDAITVSMLDSVESPKNFGSAASRMGVMYAGATDGLAKLFIDRLKQHGSEQLGCNPSDLSYDGGVLTVDDGTSSLSLAAIAETRPEDVTVTYDYTNPAFAKPEFDEAMRQKYPTYPATAFSVDAPIVEVDIETGLVDILRYYSLHDCGTLLNPAIVDGQVEGAIAHGIGAALLEEFAYDDAGYPRSVTFFEYLLPSVWNVPEIHLEHQETPSPFTPRGVKGAGEGGVISASATIPASINAALEPLGVEIDRLPATPDRIRSLIRESRSDSGSDRL